MDFRQFRTFVIAAEQLHLGRTAELLGIAQPAVTQQIKSLEAQLGFKVFHRVRRGIELTEAGAIFLEHAQAALAKAETAVLAGRRASRGELGKICIAYAHSAMLEPELPALLKRFSEARPDVELELRDITVQEQVSALADERIDVAFLRSPPGPLPASIKLTAFSRQPLDVVLPRNHPAVQSDTLTLRDLANERFIVVDDPPGIGIGHRVLQLCMEAGFEPAHVLRAGDSVSIVSLVSAGLGVGLVPRSLSRFGIDDAVFKPIPMANCFTEIVIATRAFDRSATTRLLLEFAQKPTGA
ncbi:LysR family transcriptional regulator [Paraburkholderia sp.]|uniref:LysR family transcriptional regulator n=1 Tax=Paraburkholderia sp. TaxID=1926495 RepID=UPI002399D3E5|nr:LysR family transcriptional regulator [Paraburkholderia sp.]MDE1179910.1 LysR family transcriptional regulator [Paraburkholderia sp.]